MDNVNIETLDSNDLIPVAEETGEEEFEITVKKLDIPARPRGVLAE